MAPQPKVGRNMQCINIVLYLIVTMIVCVAVQYWPGTKYSSSPSITNTRKHTKRRTGIFSHLSFLYRPYTRHIFIVRPNSFWICYKNAVLFQFVTDVRFVSHLFHFPQPVFKHSCSVWSAALFYEVTVDKLLWSVSSWIRRRLIVHLFVTVKCLLQVNFYAKITGYFSLRLDLTDESSEAIFRDKHY